jgi:hypothetical protein
MNFSAFFFRTLVNEGLLIPWVNPPKELYLDRNDYKDLSFSYTLSNTRTRNSWCKLSLQPRYQDTQHGISVIFSVCADIFQKSKQFPKAMTQFLHLSRDIERNKKNITSSEDLTNFFNSVVELTVDSINQIKKTHPDAKILFVESQSSKFNSEVKKRIEWVYTQSSTDLITKQTYKDFQNLYKIDTEKFIKDFVRYPDTRRGKLIKQGLDIFFKDLDLDSEVLNERVSLRGLARYLTYVFQMILDNPELYNFDVRKLSQSDKEFTKNVAWIQAQLTGPANSSRTRIKGDKKAITFNPFNSVPQSFNPPKTVIVVDDNINRFNTYEAINANIYKNYGFETMIIWVVGAGVKQNIEAYFS